VSGAVRECPLDTVKSESTLVAAACSILELLSCHPQSFVFGKESIGAENTRSVVRRRRPAAKTTLAGLARMLLQRSRRLESAPDSCEHCRSRGDSPGDTR